MSTQNFREDPLAPRPETAAPATPMPSAAGTGPTSGTETAEMSADHSRAEAAKDEARQVGQEGAEAGRHVADTAKDEARSVAEEATGQAKTLARTLQDELNDQAGAQQKRAAEGLRSISDELRSMADNSEQRGMATQWVQEAAGRVGNAASWLDQRDPASVLEETKRFARNRPGTFLAIAAGAGLAAGRLARGLKSNSEDSTGSDSRPASSTTSPSTRPTAATTPAAGLATPVAGYPSQAPGYPSSTPGGAPSQVEPTFPDDGARGLS